MDTAGSCAFAAPDVLASVAAAVGSSIVAGLLQPLILTLVQPGPGIVGSDPGLEWALTIVVETAVEIGAATGLESEDG